jgi:hypothetical protein
VEEGEVVEVGVEAAVREVEAVVLEEEEEAAGVLGAADLEASALGGTDRLDQVLHHFLLFQSGEGELLMASLNSLLRLLT